MMIAVDIDDTLYSFNQLAREMFVDVSMEKGDKRLQRGAYCAWGEWRSPADVIDPDYWMEIIDRCHDDDVILEQKPFPGAAETLQELSYHRLMYITNRKEEAYDATMNWLIDNDFPYRSGDLICTKDDKQKYLAHCQYLIDDRPKTLVQFVYDYDWTNKHGTGDTESARKAFGLFGEYNRALTDVPGIYLAPNWRLLRQYLIEKEVLHVKALS